MRVAWAATIQVCSLCLLTAVSASLAEPAPGGLTRGVIVVLASESPTGAAAFADALLPRLAQGDNRCTMLTADSALVNAAGLSKDFLTALGTAPPDQVYSRLLELAQRLHLDEVARLALQITPQGGSVEIVWARLAAGQVRQIEVSEPSLRMPQDADLLASLAARALTQGWAQATPVAPETQPALPPPPPTSATQVLPPPPEPEVPPASPLPAPSPPEVAAPATLVQTLPSASPDPLAAAREALSKGDASRALDLIAGAIRQGAPQIPALLLRARAYASLQNDEQRRVSLVSAIALDPTLYEPRLELASLQAARGLWQPAVELLQQAIAARPQAPAAYLQLSALYERQRQPALALETLRAGAEASPENLPLLTALSRAYRDRNLLPAAEETYAQIAALSQGEARAEAYLELGRMYMAALQFGAAFTAYQEAAQASEDTATHFEEMFSACDGVVAEALEEAFSLLKALDQKSREMTREEAYTRLRTAVQQMQKIRDFAAEVKPLPAHQRSYDLRMVYYALATEAATNALVYVDTGAANMRAQAERQHQEAVALPRSWSASPSQANANP